MLVPRSSNLSPIWFKCNEALCIICNQIPLIDKDLFCSFWNIVADNHHNNSRKRCLLHLKTGSFDISNSQITTDLSMNISPDSHILVVQIYCTPLQIIGTEESHTIFLTFEFIDCLDLSRTSSDMEISNKESKLTLF